MGALVNPFASTHADKDFPLRTGLRRYMAEPCCARLQNVRIGIAGAGGLGSNVAMMLARSGVEHFTLIDGDTVDASNLNRQHYFPCHIGMPKVHALAAQLATLNPHITASTHTLWLNEQNINDFLPLADIWVEALDTATTKRLFAERAQAYGAFTVCASGIGGYGGKPMQSVRLAGMVIVGDFASDTANAAPFAPRVTEAAALQADAVLAHILRDMPNP